MYCRAVQATTVDDKPVEAPDDPPLIAPKLGRFAQKHHVGLSKIICFRKEDGGEQRLYILHPDNPEPGEAPEGDDPDVVAEWCMYLAELDYDETGEKARYRFEFHVTDRANKTLRKNCTIDFPADEATGRGGRGVVDTDNSEDVHDVMTIWAAERAQLNNVIQVMVTHNENLISRLLDQSRAQDGQIQPLLTVIQTLMGKYDEGLRMTANALKEMLQAKYDTKQAELEAEGTNEMWRTLKPALKVAAAQFGSFASKMMDDKDDDDDDDEDDDEDVIDDNGDDDDGDDDAQGDDDGDGNGDGGEQVKPPPRKKTQAKRKSSSSKKSDKRTATTATSRGVSQPKRPKNMPKDKLIVTVTENLLHSLHPDQWFKLQDAMTKEQYELLRQAREAKNDDQCAELILELQGKLFANLRRAKKIQGVLNQEQQDGLEKLALLAEKHIEEKEAKEAKADA